MFKRNKQAVSRENIKLVLNKKLIVVSLSLLIAGTVAAWAIYSLNKSELFPIDTIRAQGSFVYVTESMLNKAIDNVDGKGFFTINVARVKEQVESLAWVKQASIKRVWPGTLNITVNERTPVAILKSGGLVDSTGEIFYPKLLIKPENLVEFDVSDSQVKSCLNYYYDSIVMLKNLGLQVTKVTYTNRQALSYRLNDKFDLVLGRENKLYRLNRFAKIYKNNLDMENKHIKNIDMRYTNGLSVEWEAGHKSADVSKKNIALNNREPGHV